MKTRLIPWIAAILICLPMAYADTLTFEDVPSGTILSESPYVYQHRIAPSNFIVSDHEASSWGLPHSGRNVLTAHVAAPFAIFGFGILGPSFADWDHVQSFSAFFGTNTSIQVRMTAYHIILPDTAIIVATVVIGAPGESWNDEFRQINTTPDLTIESIRFEGVNSQDDLLGFCLDDMTYNLVPEPSSLLALGGGLGALGLLRRRRYR